MDQIIEISREGILLGIIIRSSYQAEGIHFFTPGEFSQQLAYMHHPAGHEIQPHIHNHIERRVQYTQEVLLIRRGRLQVDFYDDNREFYRSEILGAGDLILLAAGGHGFKVLEEVEMIEVKQGPYLGEMDKIRFERK